jgi:hypothetical protein
MDTSDAAEKYFGNFGEDEVEAEENSLPSKCLLVEV